MSIMNMMMMMSASDSEALGPMQCQWKMAGRREWPLAGTSGRVPTGPPAPPPQAGDVTPAQVTTVTVPVPCLLACRCVLPCSCFLPGPVCSHPQALEFAENLNGTAPGSESTPACQCLSCQCQPIKLNSPCYWHSNLKVALFFVFEGACESAAASIRAIVA
jgi:hypothetical protein